MTLENEFEKFTLYVGNLDSSVEENELHEIFNEVTHAVSSVKICRDRNNGMSLGYAYVNFNQSSKAKSAMKELNYNKLKGKPMRIMFSERDPSKRRSGRGNVFVKNLHESIDEKQLSDMFSSFGQVLSSKVVCDASGVSKGYGYVQFFSELSVDIACNSRNQHIHVCPFVSRRQWDESPVFTNVYVKNLAETATDPDLKKIFEEFGEISSAVVMRDGKGKSKKFGFVNFEKPEAAVNAIEKMNGTIVDEKELYVGRAQKKKNRVEELITKFKIEKARRDVRTRKGLNLYVKNLEDDVNDKMLQELFSEFGTITSCKVMVQSNSISKGVGFVEFSTSEEASKAMLKMNGKMVGNKQIYVSLAQCKEDRLHLQQSNNMSRNVASSTPTHDHPILGRAAGPASMLPPQPPFRGYSLQPHLMFGTIFPNGCPAMPIPSFMVPQSFPPGLYPPAPPVNLHYGLQPMMSGPPPQPQLWNPHLRI